MTMRKAAAFSTPTTLREALALMVLHSGVSVEEQVAAIREAGGGRISPSYLYNAVNPNLDEEGWHYQLRNLLPNIHCTKNPIVVDWFCRELHSVRLPILPALDFSVPTDVEQWRKDNHAVVCELGELTGAIERGLEDQDMCAQDAKETYREAMDVVQRAAYIAHRARQVWEGRQLSLALPHAG